MPNKELNVRNDNEMILDSNICCNGSPNNVSKYIRHNIIFYFYKTDAILKPRMQKGI